LDWTQIITIYNTRVCSTDVSWGFCFYFMCIFIFTKTCILYLNFFFSYYFFFCKTYSSKIMIFEKLICVFKKEMKRRKEKMLFPAIWHWLHDCYIYSLESLISTFFELFQKFELITKLSSIILHKS